MAEHYSSVERGGRRWLLQRLTAVFLIGVLAFHVLLLHFANHAADITFAGTQARMSQVGYFATMWLFLVTATFHGINGVYNALVNRVSTAPRRPRSNGCWSSPACCWSHRGRESHSQ